MNKSQKFASDLRRIQKMAWRGGAFDKALAVQEMERLWKKQNERLPGLAGGLFDWWKSEYCAGKEIGGAALEKLCAVQAFLLEEDDYDALEASDWARIKDEIRFEAQNIPLELLSSFMQTLVSRGALD